MAGSKFSAQAAVDLFEKAAPGNASISEMGAFAKAMEAFVASRKDIFEAAPCIDALVEMDRSVLESFLAPVPEPARSEIFEKFKMRVPKTLVRRLSFWLLPDKSGFMRIESPNWASVAPIFEKISERVAADHPDREGAKAKMKAMAEGAKAKVSVVPLSALDWAVQARGLSERGELVEAPMEWREGVVVKLFPQIPTTPRALGQKLDGLGVAKMDELIEELKNPQG